MSLLELDPAGVRQRLAFDVERLRGAASRIERVDEALARLKRELEHRATALAGQATSRVLPELGGDGLFQIRHAQAQATAELARRATLGEVLAHSGRLALIASMAVSRWVSALAQLGRSPHAEVVIKGHIDAGRLAHRMLVTLRPQDDLKSGCGQVASAVVVAELVHQDNLAFVSEQIEEGLVRGQSARGVHSPEDVVAAASRALRSAASLLERMAKDAEPAALDLSRRADEVEAEVARALLVSAHDAPGVRNAR